MLPSDLQANVFGRKPGLAKRPFVQTHRYRAEEFGLTDDMIAERFGTYMQHFQIERERSAPRP
jgi:hypothetical protein